MKRHAAMNRIYRLVWSRVSNAWVAVAENAKGRGKAISGRKLIAAALALTGSGLLVPLALAAPTGGQISAGEGSIAQTGANTTITQSSQNLAINWQGFSIAADEAVRFNQPNATAIALNRVLGQDPSQILGSLSANGQVFILNPNGVLFGTGSQVNVGGLVASTLSLSDADFIAGNNTFSNAGTAGAVVNQGTLTAAQGGYIALLAPEVRNEGVISATLGTALLAAGDKVTLTLNNGSLLSYSIDQGALNALAENKQLIQADGGQVFMSAKAANALSTAMVNNTGIIEARTVQNVAGVIMLMGDMQVGTVNVGGTLDASAPNGGNGGFIETSAAHVNIANNAKVTTAAPNGSSGTWLIDPVDFTIAATGGNMTGATLSTNLANNAVVSILSINGTTGTAGDINVNDVVTWSANQLVLNAQNNININANLNASGTASLALIYGQGAVAAGNTSNIITANGAAVNLPAGTTNFTTLQGSNGVVKNYTVITSLGAPGSTTATDLQGMNGNRAANYALGSDINAAGTSTWNAGAGFAPIGDEYPTRFTGTFDGLGHTISSLTINRSTTYVGLFGYTDTARIQNVGLVGGSVSSAGSGVGGGLIGFGYRSTVNNSYATGSVTGGANSSNVGGLIGSNAFGAVSNSYATGSVSGAGYVGGLVGASAGSTISNSYATGSVSGTWGNIGGLVGYTTGAVSNSYATGSVIGGSASFYVGGLVGSVDSNDGGGSVNNSYATGSVRGNSAVGGLVGLNWNLVSSSYATGSVSGGSEVGGLVGLSLWTGTVSSSYATGSVSGSSNLGGLVGYRDGGSVSNSYWDTQTSGRSIGIGFGTTTGAIGRTSAEMMSMASFTGFNIANTGGSGAVWRIYEGQTTPWLTWWLKPLTVAANSDSKPYDGAPYSGGNGVTYSFAPDGSLLYGSADFRGTSQGAINVGSYAITPGLYSVQQGYDISSVDGTLTINPAEIITSPTGGILPAVVEAIIALPGGADLLPMFSSTVTVAATQIDAVAPPPALSNLQYVYVTTTPGTLSGDIDTTVGGEAVPIKAQSNRSDGFNERLADAPIQFTGTVLVRNGGINLPGDADDANARDRKRGNK